MKCLIILLLGTSNLIKTQNTQAKRELYQGKIGPYSIILQLAYYQKGNLQELYDCSYYYKNQGKKIELTLSEFKSNRLILGTDKFEYQEEFVLERLNDRSWTGYWQRAKEKKLKVTLTPLDINTIKHNMSPYVCDWKENDPLIYALTSKLEFKQNAISYSGKFSIYWYKDNLTGMSFFRLGKTHTVLNNLLLMTHLELIKDYIDNLRCDGDEDEVFEINCIGDSLLSYYNSKGICYRPGAAHPFLGYDVGTIDIKNEKLIEFDELFNFTNKVLPSRNKNWKEWIKYREKIVAPTIVDLLRQSNKELKDTPKNYERVDDGACYYLTNEIWQNLDGWNLSKEGLIIRYFEPARGYGPCMNWFTIPFTYLTPFINPKYQPYFINSPNKYIKNRN